MDDDDSSSNLWHRWLENMSQKSLEVPVKGKHLLNFKNTQLDLYTDYLVEKKRRVSFAKKVAPLKRTRPLELVHTNVCSPLEVQTFSRARYFVTFIDDYSRKLWTYIIRRKDSVRLFL